MSLSAGPLLANPNAREPCPIDRPELRGISLRQLRSVVARAAAVTPTAVTMADMVRMLGRPATAALECSITELVTTRPQPPTWYVVVHEEVRMAELVECLAQHADDRGLSENHPYWIGTCALSLHAGEHHATESLASGSDLRACTFFRALLLTAGTVCVADRGGHTLADGACALQLWASAVHTPASRLHDCYALREGEPEAVGLVDGFALSDAGSTRSKLERERAFPRAVVSSAHRFAMATARTPPGDERARLVALAAERGDGQRATSSFDATVRAVFAALALSGALDTEPHAAAAPAALGDSLRALRASRLQRLAVRLAEPSVCALHPALAEPPRPAPSESHGVAVGDALPSTLAELRVRRVGPRVVAGVARVLAAAAPLRHLTLADCAIGDEHATQLAQAMRLASGVRAPIDAAARPADDADGPATAWQLRTLDLSSNQIGDAGARALADALRDGTCLKVLDLSSNAIGDGGARPVGEALADNAVLVKLDLSGNRIADAGAEALSAGVQRNAALTTLDLSSNRLSPAGVAALNAALSCHATLSMLDASRNRGEHVPQDPGDAQVRGALMTIGSTTCDTGRSSSSAETAG